MNSKQKKWLKMIIMAILCLAVAIIIIYGFKIEQYIGKWALLLYLPAYLIAGGEVLKIAGKNILAGRVFDENFLMSLATIGAFCIGEYNEAVAVMIFYQVGELFQNYAVSKARESIQSLMEMAPDCANVVVGSEVEEKDIYDVEPGSKIVVKPGEKIPLDGVIIEGESTLDTSSITGESYPQDAMKGDDVYSGTINLTSVIYIETTKLAGDSMSAKILEMVENAIEKKAKKERFITRFAKYYTPVVVIMAVLIAFVPPLILHDNFPEWISRALIFLVISCPCALVISIPMGFFAGIGAASKRGILVKGGTAMESLSKVDIVGFDKTGTITTGEFRVEKINAFIMEEDKLLEMVANVESCSNHPISKTIVNEYKDRQLNNSTGIKEIDVQESGFSKPKDMTEIAGKGMSATISGNKILIGNIKLMEEHSVSGIDGIHLDIADNIKHERATVIHVAIDGQYAGNIELVDDVKKNVSQTIRNLKRLGIKKTVMLTGDNEGPAKYVACLAEIDDVKYRLLPEDKLSNIENLKMTGKVAFVGDGINDAPVLAGADVGIAMGAMGSDAAIEVSDVVIMDDNISNITKAIQISKKTIRIVNQNIVFALGCKGLILILGALGAANIWAAVFADVGVAVIAILNSMRASK